MFLKSRYSGCGGNGNNFQTGDNCVKNCGGKIGEVINDNKNINERIVLPTMKRTTSTTTPAPTIAPPTKQDSKKRKMKRVRISARGRSRSRSEEAGDSVGSSSNVSVVRTRTSPRSRNESARSRTNLSRARSRVRSRTSSSSSLVSSSTEQSVSLRLAELDLPRFRRPSRTIADYAVQSLRREDGERIKGPRVDTSTSRHEATRSHEKNITRTFEKSRKTDSNKTETPMSKRVLGVATITRVSSPSRGRVARHPSSSQSNHIGGRRHRERVDEVMKSPPNMKGGLVVIRSYCR